MAQIRGTVLFSGGGTAGHLAPGFALAEQLEARGVRTLFATPGEPVETAWFGGRPAPARIPATRLPRGPWSGLRFPFQLARGVWAARRVLKRERVGCLVALGGWPCAPAALAARGARVPLVFLVPDAVPGVVVQKLASRAARIYVVHAEAAEALDAGDRVHVSGPLVGERVAAGARDPGTFGLRADRRTLFVTGGSLGARGLNEAFLLGLEAALREDPSLGERVQVLHSVGARGLELAARYEGLPVVHRVVEYVRDMGSAYRTADLVLCRAGANTCAELAATTTPAVLVPYPHHADRQQFKNAAPLVAAGGARLVEEADLTPGRIRDVIDLLEDARALAAMRTALESAVVSGAGESAEDLIRFLGWDARAAAGG